MGAIDYYDQIAKNLSTNKKIPPTIYAYLEAQAREKIQSLNELLMEKGWLGSNNIRIKKIQKKIKSADWLEEEKELKAIKAFYDKSIKEIVSFYQSEPLHFGNIENDVHEMRRKLRWLSIYPQALRGNIQLRTLGYPVNYLSKYLTEEIISSPFNTMPNQQDAAYVLMLSKNHFYALSWVIAELGKIKDNGL